MTAAGALVAGLGVVGLFLLPGLGLVELLPALRERPLAARFGWAYLLGVATTGGSVTLLAILFGLPLRRPWVFAPAVLLALAGLAARLRRGRPEPRGFRPPRSGRVAARAAFALGTIVFCGLFARALRDAEIGWDAEMQWSVAARWMRAEGSILPPALTDARAFVNSPQYPPLVPVAQVVAQEALALPADRRAVQPLFTAFFPAVLLVLFDLGRRRAGTFATALAVFAFAEIPLLADPSGGAAGAYADLPLAAFWGAGLLLLLERPRPSAAVAAAIFLGAATLTKNEGAPYAAAAVAVAILAALLRRPLRRARLGAAALALAAVATCGGALSAWRAHIPQRWTVDYAARLHEVSLRAEAAARLPLLPAAIAKETFDAADWSGFWFAALAALGAGAAAFRRRVAPPLALALGLSLAAYVGALLLSTWGGAEQVHPTWNRFVVQMTFPIFVLLAMALRASWRARGAAAAAWRSAASGAGIIPPVANGPLSRARVFRREALVFFAFLLLTVAMTWPWARHLYDHCSDNGDPYLVSWTLWWDFHQTFHDPFHLFDGNVFFPNKLSLAFSEHNYGLALPLFPLFALGLRPLTAQGVLTLLGFAFSGYGAFRLGRTLTGSTGAAWVTGLAFAFVPWRLGQISHVAYLFSGWVPILLEALVLFVRERTPRRAAWLGLAFFFNALSVIHWFVLTLVPLAVTGIALAFRAGVEKDREGLRRGAIALAAAMIALLPFLLPYRRAASLYGFTRSIDETREYSALPKDWLNMDPWNRTWRGFCEFPSPGERCLFPGFLLLALPLAAVLLSRRSAEGPAPAPFTPPNPRALRWLDGVTLVAGAFALFAASPVGIHVWIAGKQVFRATDPARALAVFLVALGLRWTLAYPEWLPFVRRRNLPESLRALGREDVVVVGGTWALLGFLASLGVHSPYHRVLFETVFLLRSVRVPARSANIAYLGLALLAGAGALALATAWRKRRPGSALPLLVFAAAGAGLLFEDRGAPLDLARGEADPDEVTLFLKKTPMTGGLVELPAGTPEHGNYRAMLRAADHGKPLITATSGFSSPIVQRIEEDERKNPIPDDFLDFLEGIPTSYVLVHDAWLDPALRATHRPWIDRGLASGRLVFVKRFDGEARNDLFAVAKNEPAARSLEALPWTPPPGLTPSGSPWREDASLTGSVDEPAEGATVRGPLRVTGWARIPGEDLEVTLLIDGERRPPAGAARVPRRDVEAAVRTLGDCATAGYDGTFAFRPADAGAHEIVALFRSRDGRERHYPPRRFVWKP